MTPQPIFWHYSVFPAFKTCEKSQTLRLLMRIDFSDREGAKHKNDDFFGGYDMGERESPNYMKFAELASSWLMFIANW